MSVVLAAADLLASWAALMSSRAPGRDRLMRIVRAAYETTDEETQRDQRDD